jgi:hypothetical protein
VPELPAGTRYAADPDLWAVLLQDWRTASWVVAKTNLPAMQKVTDALGTRGFRMLLRSFVCPTHQAQQVRSDFEVTP